MTLNGERVKQAREILGLTQAQLAEAAGVNQSTIARLEGSLIENPEEQHLEAISLRTGFPPAFFRQEQGPEFPLGSLLFRQRRSLTSQDKARLRQLARLVYEMAEKLAALRPQHVEIGIQRFSGSPPRAARATRDALGLSPDTPILKLLHQLERAGIFVFPLPVDIPRYDAFSLWADVGTRRPIIVVSANRPGDRQRFSLAHELGHLVLHHPVTVGNARVEAEANEFAAEFLMPEEAMRREFTPPLPLTHLAELKGRWGVSIQALIMRAFALRLLTRRQVAQRFKLLSARGWRVAEPVVIPAEKPRLLMKMAEEFCGGVLNIERIGGLIHAPARLIGLALEGHATKTGPGKPQGATLLDSARALDSGSTPERGQIISLAGRSRRTNGHRARDGRRGK